MFTKAIAAGMTPARAARLAGYASVIQHFGAYESTMLTRKGQDDLRKDFEKLGCNPKQIERLDLVWAGLTDELPDTDANKLPASAVHVAKRRERQEHADRLLKKVQQFSDKAQISAEKTRIKGDEARSKMTAKRPPGNT